MWLGTLGSCEENSRLQLARADHQGFDAAVLEPVAQPGEPAEHVAVGGADPVPEAALDHGHEGLVGDGRARPVVTGTAASRIREAALALSWSAAL